jgi:hypothetical protein
MPMTSHDLRASFIVCSIPREHDGMPSHGRRLRGAAIGFGSRRPSRSGEGEDAADGTDDADGERCERSA